MIAASAQLAPRDQDWSAWRNVRFRFALAYWFLFAFPFPAGTIPYTGWSSTLLEKLWDAVIPWFGHRVLGISREIPTAFNGSGDRTFDWVSLVFGLVLSLLIALGWSLITRRREHRRLSEWLHVYLRYVLAATMLSYGLSKVLKIQFPDVEPTRLLTPLGDYSPMGLLWTFMGWSTGYSFFAGASEVLGGLLLLSRRTSTLGALVTAGVMANVAVLNFCYDVPVKIYSSQLLILALYLAAPDLERLANVLVLNRATLPAERPARPRWQLGLKLAFVGVLLFTQIKSGIEEYFEYGRGAPEPPLYGLYEVESFSGAGQPWSRLAFDKVGQAKVRDTAGGMQRYPVKTDGHQVTFVRLDDGVKFKLTWSRPDSDHLQLDGMLDGKPLSARLRKMSAENWLLTSRGFHWINEFPFNR